MTWPTPPTSPYAVIVNDVGVARHHGSKMVTSRLVDELSARGLSVVTIPAGHDWRHHTQWIDGASAVVLNGEGTLHHSAPAAQALLGLGPYCQSRNLPVFLVNSLWQDNSALMVQQAKSFTAVFVRESRSRQELVDSGVDATVVADLVIGWPVVEEPDTSRKGVVITDSVVLPDTNLLAKAARKVDAVFTTLEPASPEPLDYARSSFIRLNDEPTFGPMALWRGAVRFAYLVRGRMAAAIRRRLGHQVEFSLNDFITVLRHSELLVTGRFHAVCLAMITGTPFLTVSSNSHKIDAMLDDAGLPNRSISVGAVTQAVVRPPQWTEAEATAVSRYVDQAIHAQKDMFDTIAGHALGNRSGEL